MLGGIAQAEVNDQLKDLDESASHAPGTKWKGISPSNPIYQVYGHQNSDYGNTASRPKKNTKNTSNANSHPKQNFPLINSLLHLNKLKNAAVNKQRNNNNNNSNKNPLIADYSNWSQLNKKQRSELQGAASNQQNVYVLRAVNGKNKHSRDDRKNLPAPSSISRVREPSRDMRPPPPLFRPKIKPPPPLF